MGIRSKINLDQAEAFPDAVNAEASRRGTKIVAQERGEKAAISSFEGDFVISNQNRAAVAWQYHQRDCETTRSARASSRRWLLWLSVAAILGLGLALRLAWLPPYPEGDVLLIGNWSKFAAFYGLGALYDPQQYAAYTRDAGITGYLATPTIYPPFLMTVLAALGVAYRALAPTFTVTDPAFLLLLRAPALLADLAAAGIVFWEVGRRRTVRLGLLGAAAYVLSPAIAYTSGWAGHFDSVYTLFLLLTFVAAVERRPGLAGVCFALAVLTKLQAGAVFLILAVAVYQLSGRSGFVRLALGGAAMTLAVLAPYLLHGALPDLLDSVVDSFGYYPYLSVGALNFWQLIAWINWGALHGKFLDSVPVFLSVTPRLLGLGMVGAVSVVLMVSLWRRPDGDRVYLAAALQVFGFFFFATEMHERYFFPALALLAVALGRRLPTMLYIALSVTYFVNLYILFWSWQPAGQMLWLGGAAVPLLSLFNGAIILLGIGAYVFPDQAARLAARLLDRRERTAVAGPGDPVYGRRSTAA